MSTCPGDKTATAILPDRDALNVRPAIWLMAQCASQVHFGALLVFRGARRRVSMRASGDMAWLPPSKSSCRRMAEWPEWLANIPRMLLLRRVLFSWVLSLEEEAASLWLGCISAKDVSCAGKQWHATKTAQR